MRSRSPEIQHHLTSASTVLLAAALALGSAGCHKPAPPVPPPPSVQVLTITATNVPLTFEFIGQLDSPQNVEVRSRVEAFVEQVLFTEGTQVKEGDPLFLLDKKPFLQNLAAAEGMLAEAQASLGKYRTDTNRLTPLALAKAIPQQDLDNAVAAVAMGVASVQSAEARVQSAKLDLSYCEVKAPVSGLIGAKQVSVGSLVGKGQPTLLATISQLNPIWFYCAISEVDYLRAEHRLQETGRRLGDVPLTLILADGSEHPTPGKWVFLDRAVDVTTGTIRARAEFSNPKGILRPGMFARVRVTSQQDRESILVPERALVELQGKSFLWVIDADNKATQRPVKVAPARIGGNAVILEGLQAGERIVVEGVHKVREGLPVQPLTAEQLAAAQQDPAAAPGHAGKTDTEHGKE